MPDALYLAVKEQNAVWLLRADAKNINNLAAYAKLALALHDINRLVAKAQ